LLPDQEAAIELHMEGARVRFSVTRADGVALARGTFQSAQA
jgi:hypothetical protein